MRFYITHVTDHQYKTSYIVRMFTYEVSKQVSITLKFTGMIFVQGTITEDTVYPVFKCDIPDCKEGERTSATETETLRLMRCEKTRLETYWKWSHGLRQHPRSLAKAGFFYTGQDDRVKCAFCSGVLKRWEPSDDPMTEHTVHFPHCPFVNGEDVGNISINSPCHSQAKQMIENMTIETNRIKTFFAWSRGLEQKPEDLARAGFYHKGNRQKPDRVVCAYCQGVLYDWQKGDDPWVEHCRRFPQCTYMKLCMGQKFIDDIQAQTVDIKQRSSPASRGAHRGGQTKSPRDLSGSDVRVEGAGYQTAQRRNLSGSDVRIQDVGYQTTSRRNLSGSDVRIQDVGYQTTSRRNLSVSDVRIQDVGYQTRASAVDEAMKSCQVQAVLEMGYSRELVRSVVQSKLSRTGSVFTKAEDILYSVMEREDETASVHRGNEVRTSIPEMICSQISHGEDFTSGVSERYVCKVCMGNQIQVTFLPCGHLVCCAICAVALDKCPICRTFITGMVKTYY